MLSHRSEYNDLSASELISTIEEIRKKGFSLNPFLTNISLIYFRTNLMSIKFDLKLKRNHSKDSF